MVKSADRWVIKAGSPIKQRENVPDQQAASLREIYADKIESGVTTKDLVFSSPSAAARFVVGRSSNGRAAWKNAKGTPLGELQDQGHPF
ncbi:DUF4357 domain-containing protein [Corynebacterium poyangense]|uniref:DUF4357 domain-containing protein n=1 Tax=Corynebacterium poyangense TaxID=2684405 RepID=A0A7H0SLF6_9CORY|nr:DUF4357 domain-containing protein [Corynebacterium poyangense]MBZ8177474.1 DUF4357 domain-containing protein [Corynebacterium poyangense]QNQ89381.1 DUF4357 domain-containing protein [Corynebacterium poyangense]